MCRIILSSAEGDEIGMSVSRKFGFSRESPKNSLNANSQEPRIVFEWT